MSFETNVNIVLAIAFTGLAVWSHFQMKKQRARQQAERKHWDKLNRDMQSLMASLKEQKDSSFSETASKPDN